MFLSVVMVTSRPFEAMEAAVAELARQAARLSDEPCEAFVVHGGAPAAERSVDRLAVRSLALRDGDHAGEAVARALAEAGGRYRVVMNADAGHPPSAVSALVESLRDGNADLAIGRRKGAAIGRNVGRMLARPFVRAADPCSGLVAVRRESIGRVGPIGPAPALIALDLAVTAGCRRVADVPFEPQAVAPSGGRPRTWRDRLELVRQYRRLAERRYPLVSRFLQFCMVGASGMVIDLGLYTAMLAAGVLLPVARAAAIGLSMVWNFTLNRRFTFGYSRSGRIHPQFIRYALSCSLGSALSWGVSVALCLRGMPLRDWPVVAAVAGIAVGTASNFTLSRYWVFRMPEPGDAAADRAC